MSRPFVARKIRRYRRRVPAPVVSFFVPFDSDLLVVVVVVFFFFAFLLASVRDSRPFRPPFAVVSLSFRSYRWSFSSFFWCVQHHVVLLDIVAVVRRLAKMTMLCASSLQLIVDSDADWLSPRKASLGTVPTHRPLRCGWWSRRRRRRRRPRCCCCCCSSVLVKFLVLGDDQIGSLKPIRSVRRRRRRRVRADCIESFCSTRIHPTRVAKGRGSTWCCSSA